MSLIEKNSVVTVTYKLKINGDLVEEAKQDEPLVYLSGVGAMIPGFENQLNGKKVGESYKIVISPDEGYGEFNDTAIVDLDNKTFEVDGGIPEDMLKLGNSIPMQDEDGNPMEGVIIEIKKESVVLDFNHPLAGKVLEFEGEILSVRTATPEEINHKHVHGPGGVEH